MKTQEELKELFDSMNDNEKFGLRMGLFPARLMDLDLDNSESAALIRFSNEELKG